MQTINSRYQWTHKRICCFYFKIKCINNVEYFMILMIQSLSIRKSSSKSVECKVRNFNESSHFYELVLKHTKVFKLIKILIRWKFATFISRYYGTATDWNGQIKIGIEKNELSNCGKINQLLHRWVAYMNILKLILNFVIYSWIYNTVSQWYTFDIGLILHIIIKINGSTQLLRVCRKQMQYEF